MDMTLIIRICAGALFFVLLGILIMRRKKRGAASH
jgi:hypothetical protein